MGTFGERLRVIREARELTQEALGFELGLTKATISKWERGRSEPNLKQLAAIRGVFGVSLDALIVGGAQGGVADGDAAYPSQDPARAATASELAVLERLRTMSPSEQRALLVVLRKGES